MTATAVRDDTNHDIRVVDGRLCVEGLDALALAEAYGTPAFVVSEHRVRANYRRLRDAFAARWPGDLNVMYAIKANWSLAIRRILSQEGAGGDAFGLGELSATLQTGTHPARTSLGGNAKSDEAIRAAVEAGARITVDALDELPRIAAAAEATDRSTRLALRAKPDLPELNAYRSVGSPYSPGEIVALGDWIREGKWGLTLDEAAEAVEAVQRSRVLEAVGVHSHVGRHYGFQGQYAAMIPGLVRWIAALRESTGWSPRSIDLGGGWTHRDDPILRGPASQRERGGHPELWDEPRGTIDEIAELVCSTLLEELAAHRIDGVETLELEPGRYLVSDAALLLARVLSVKSQPGIATYVNVDASVSFLPLPELQDSAHRIVVADRADAPASREVRAAVVGPSCYEDLLAWRQPLPAMAPGEVVAFLDTGACADSYAANLNAIPRPPVLLVCGDRVDVVKRRETIADVFARDAIPARLWVVAS